MLSLNLSKAINDMEYNGNDYRSLAFENRIGQELSYALLVFPDVESASFIDNTGKMYTSKYQVEDNLNKALGSNILNEIDKSNGINLFFPLEKRDYLVVDKNKPVFTTGKKIFNLITGEKIGSLILTVKEDSFSSVYKNMDFFNNNSYFIVDERNIIISSSMQGELLKVLENKELLSKLKDNDNFAARMKYNGKNSLVTSTKFEKNQWKLISETPIEVLTSDTNKIGAIIIISILLCLFITFVGAIKLSKLITRPIVKLKNRMLEVSGGNLDVSFETNTTDEIGLLAKGFNTMVSQIKELIKKVNVQEKQKREFELALMSSQVKPHFLYNTLDVIYVLAEMGRGEDVKKTTKALADFYRIALSNGEELIPLKDEIENVKDYLIIQRTRYSDVFDFQIQADEKILEEMIPKLSIQPLVENCIYHGLKIKPEFGHIKIIGYYEEKVVKIVVEDDGVGMNKHVIRKIMASKESKIGHISFGIYSTDQRIKLHFGNEYGLNISSEVNVGTKFTIVIPRREGSA